MAKNIDRNMTVKEVLDRFPETAKVFQKHNLLIVGKSCGPHEPMAFFTKAHGVDYDQFAQELETSISEKPGKIERIEIDPSLIGDTIYQKFIKTALIVSVTTGCLYGAIKLLEAGRGGSFDLLSKGAIQMHGSSQLMGWVGLYIMGFFYFILPRLKGTTLVGRQWANLSFYLVLAGSSEPFSIILRHPIRLFIPSSPVFWIQGQPLSSLESASRPSNRALNQKGFKTISSWRGWSGFW
jgi:hypothetical protein